MTTDYRALCAELAERLQWFIDEDDTNEGDPDNAYWIKGKHRALDALTRARAALAQPEAESSITFNESHDSEVMRVDQRGFHYRGELIEDAGLAHRLMVTFLQRHTSMHPEVVEREDAQPAPQEPTDEELLELMPETMRDEFSYAAKVCSDATGGQVKPGIFRVCLNHTALDYARAVLARWGLPASKPVPKP
jgi:hypothetical protein